MPYSKPLIPDIGKLPPQAKELEEVVLGAIMLERGAMDAAMEVLTADCFYSEIHQLVFRAMMRLSQKSQPIDIFTVVDELKVSGHLETVGGAYFVTKLTNAIVSAANIESHCRIILQKYIGREMIRVGAEMIGSAYDESVDVFEVLDRSEQNLLDIGTRHLQSGVSEISTVLAKAVTRIEQWRHSGTAITGIPSGFPKLDRATRGWQNTDLIILAARPSVGKTAFSLALARHASQNPIRSVPVGIWSLEMEDVQLVLRMLSAESGIYMHAIQTGRLDEEQMRSLYKQGVEKLAKTDIYIDDSPGLTIMSLRAKARRMKKKHGLGLMIVDYLQLMNGDDDRNREREIAKISRGLKRLAKELKIPVIALSQLNRAIDSRTGTKRQPQLSDLRESGAIEQDADVVVFLWGPDEDEINNDASLSTRCYAKIAKARNGMLLTVDLEFRSEVQQFSEAPDGDSFPVIPRPQPPLPPGNFRPVNLPYKDKDDPF